jgi:hypothetical protein
MRELETLLARCDTNFKFHRLNNRIRCFPHIINICVSHIVALCTRVSKENLKLLNQAADSGSTRRSKLLSEGDDDLWLFDTDGDNNNNDEDDEEEDDNNNDDDDNDDDDGDDDNGDDDDYYGNNINNKAILRRNIPQIKLKGLELDGLSAKDRAWFLGMKRNPIARAREVVRILRSSDQRKQDFEEVIKNGNKSGWFRGVDSSVVVVPNLEPKRDVKTRWDSTYNMIERLLVLRPVSLPVVSCFNHSV